MRKNEKQARSPFFKADSQDSYRRDGIIENVLYFRHNAYGDGIGSEVWRMDLENNLTSLLHDVYPGEGDSNPTGFVVYKDKLFFGAYEPAFGAEIWYITV